MSSHLVEYIQPQFHNLLFRNEVYGDENTVKYSELKQDYH